jgi:hypothetical protein
VKISYNGGQLSEMRGGGKEPLQVYGGEGEYQSMSFGRKTLKRKRLKKCERKRKKG